MSESDEDPESSGTLIMQNSDEGVSESGEEQESNIDGTVFSDEGSIEEDEAQGGIEMQLSLFDKTLTCAVIAAGWLEKAFRLSYPVKDSVPTQRRAEELQYYGWANRDSSQSGRFAQGIVGATDMKVRAHGEFQSRDVFSRIARSIEYNTALVEVRPFYRPACLGVAHNSVTCSISIGLSLTRCYNQ